MFFVSIIECLNWYFIQSPEYSLVHQTDNHQWPKTFSPPDQIKINHHSRCCERNLIIISNHQSKLINTMLWIHKISWASEGGSIGATLILFCVLWMFWSLWPFLVINSSDGPGATSGHVRAVVTPNNNNSNNNYSYDNNMGKFTDSLLTLRTSNLPPLPEFLRFESLFNFLLKMTTMQEK